MKKILLPLLILFLTFFSISFSNPVYANPWESCCYGTTAGCRTYDPNTGWRGVCSTSQFDCYPNGVPPQTQTWSACSATCGGGTQTCTQSNGCGLTSNCGTRACNTGSCTPTSPPEPTVTPLGPTSTPVPTATPGGPTLTPVPTITPGGPNLTPVPTNIPGVCPLKGRGDANCDGKVDEGDYKLWLAQFDTMVSASPVNQNANYACVEGNSQTYFVDLADFEVWRRNTTAGLVSTNPNQPSGPTQIPGSSGISCTSTGNCAAGYCCAQGTKTCQSANTAGITCLTGTPGTQVTPAPTSSSQSNQNGSGSGGGNNDKTQPGDNTGADRAAQEKLDRLNDLEHLRAKDQISFIGSDSEKIYNGLRNEFGLNDNNPNNDLVKSDENKNGDGIDYSWR